LRNTWPRTSTENRKQFRQLESSKVIENGAIRQITYDFLFDFQSKYKCLSHAISEILRDEKRCGFSQKKLVAMSFIYGQSSTIPADFVKIGPVDVEIIALTEITKNI